MNSEPDDLTYLNFTGPGRRDKAINQLEGIFRGIDADRAFNSQEIKELKEWCSDNEKALLKSTFSELANVVMRVVADDCITSEEREDVLWVLKNLKTESEYYDEVTTDIQKLHGALHGIAADQKIDEAELRGLQDWLGDHEHLKGTYPFDEVESLITGILKDGIIDAEEHETLINFFETFIDYSLKARMDRAVKIAKRSVTKLNRGGICAVDPLIVFPENTFVFTGISAKASRAEMRGEVVSRQGRVTDHVPTCQYLVVGNDGNPAWAFSCYGRKVELAMQLRQEGKTILIVNEVDFWDALC
jgi:NAD-dependent DNA ligase